MEAHHEVCVCGHCRCQHFATYAECQHEDRCVRYTWPGPGADLPPDHDPAGKFPRPRGR
jgi:hypothetical protein